MADCPKYRYVDSWTQTVLNVFLSDYRGYTPVRAEYVAWQVTVNSINFGPWTSAEIHVEGLDDLGDVRQSFEYTCLATDTYPKTFGTNSLGGATVQLRYYIQVPVNHVGSPISWDFEIQFIGDCVATERLYLTDENAAGFGWIDGTWHHFGAPLNGSPNYRTVTGFHYAPDNSNKVYAFAADDPQSRIWISNDAGRTWTGKPGPPNTALGTWSIRSPQSGHILVLWEHRVDDPTSGAYSEVGIWRSINDGDTWTRVIPVTPVTPSGTAYTTYAYGNMDVSDTKVWWTELFSETPAGGGRYSPRTWRIKRANFDGTSIQIVATQTSDSFTNRHKVSAYDDSLCLAADGKYCLRIRPGVDGDVEIRPIGLFTPTDLMALDPLTYLATGGDSNGDLVVFRTQDAGDEFWTLTTTIPYAQSYFDAGSPDTYPMLSRIRGDVQHAAMMGNAWSDFQQYIWASGDGGLTWVQTLNEADPFDGSTWMALNQGGIYGNILVAAALAVPSRLATIVG